MLTITHTHTQGTLIEGTHSSDGTAGILKSSGWRWSRSLRSWYVPRSRDRPAQLPLIDVSMDRLRTAGHTVTLTIDDRRRAAATIEADTVARQTARVKVLTSQAERRQQAADDLDARADELSNRLPLGQPILIGHHSENPMRRYIAKVHDTARAAVEAQREADLAAERARTAGHTTGARYSPLTVANRIETLTASIRAAERRRDHPPESQTSAAGGDFDHVADNIARLTEQLGYWRQIRDQQIDTGQVADHGPDTVQAGDEVKIRGTWHSVVRANHKTVTVPSPSGQGNRTSPYREIQAHRRLPV